MGNNWMVRAGRGGIHSEDFEKGYVAIGWSQLGDLTHYKSDTDLREKYLEIYGNDKPAATANAIAMILKFRDQIKVDDFIVSYNPETRNYLIGQDKGEYQHKAGVVGDYHNLRRVGWLGAVQRDSLSQKSRNSLGSTLTLFSVKQDVMNEFLAVLEGKPANVAEQQAGGEGSGVISLDNEVAQLKDETVAQSHELIKDKIVALSPDEMEELVASILRAMGYKAKVSPKGPDRGVDVIASPDGLGLTKPRIKAEVKHRKGNSMGAPDIRGFIGALREGDSGLFISTGGFTREARYEAERATIPLTLVDLDDLADLIVGHYEKFDLEGRALVPLVRIYWPVD